MAITKERKKETIDKLKTAFADSGSVVFANYKGVDANDTNEFRADLREKEVGYTVAKKTLVSLALDEAPFEGDKPEFEGELAIAWSGDILASAREIYALEKKFDGGISVLGGVFENKYMDREGMVEIASIPPMETLRAQFVNVINSPIQGLAVALSEIGKKKEA